jgi:hypothetical protein
MCIILPKREELKQPPTNPFGCQNPQQHKHNINMVTPPKYHPNSKLGQGGGIGGNKRPQHQNSHHIKRNQNTKAPTTLAAMQLHTPTVPQKGRQNHHKSKQINNPQQQQQNRTSPNPTNNYHRTQQQQQQQRHNNRQTPPRNVVTNHVNMNNGQPSLVELTPTTPANPAPKNVVTPNKHSQKTFQDSSFRTQKGHTITNHGSRSSPVLTNLSKSNRSSPQGFAGSKCFEPPTPNSLPKPPSDWTPFQFPSKQNLFGNVGTLTFDDMAEANADSYLDNHFTVSSTARDVSQELKLILNVNA